MVSRRRIGPAGGAPRDNAPVCPQCHKRWSGAWDGSHESECALGLGGWGFLDRLGQHYAAPFAAYLRATGGPEVTP